MPNEYFRRTIILMGEDDAIVGKTMFDLVFGFQNWVHRRVERLEMLPSGDCIRHQSVDFTLPKGYVLQGKSKGRALLPISFMEKGPLSNFSATGPDGRPIPVLETRENGQLAVSLLQALALLFCQHMTAFQDKTLRGILEEIVFGPPNKRDEESEFYGWEAAEVLEELVSRLDEHLAQQSEEPDQRPAFLAIARQFWRFFLLVFEVPISCANQRTILKFSYREQRLDRHGKPRFDVNWTFNDLGFTKSFHIEFEPPPLLRSAAVSLTEETGEESGTKGSHTDGIIESIKRLLRWLTQIFGASANIKNIERRHHTEVHRRRDQVRIIHIAWSPGSLFSTARLRVVLVPKNHGIVGVSLSAVVGVLIFLLLVIAIREARTQLSWFTPAGAPAGTAVSLASPSAAAALIAGAGVLLTWLARTPEDEVVARILAAPRRHLMYAAVPLVGAASLIVLPVPEPARTYCWYGLAGLSLFIVGVAVVFRVRAMSVVRVRYLMK